MSRFRIKMTKFQILTHVAALAPLALLIWDYQNNNLTFNPIQEMTFRTGKYALVLLVLSLACTPVNTVFGIRQVLLVRRALGLFAFMYAGIHFMIFVYLDYGLDWNLLKEAIIEKRYALVGLAAFIIMVPLAITSTQGWIRRLKRNWRRLHRMVYLAGIFAVIHYTWLVKSDIREPLAYGAVVVLLLFLRVSRVKKAVSNLRRSISQRFERRERMSARVASTESG